LEDAPKNDENEPNYFIVAVKKEERDLIANQRITDFQTARSSRVPTTVYTKKGYYTYFAAKDSKDGEVYANICYPGCYYDGKFRSKDDIDSFIDGGCNVPKID